MQDVWSRAYRRKQKALEVRGEAHDDDESQEIDHEKATLGFKIQTRLERGASGSSVSIRWLKGFDPVLYESFCGMMKRKLEAENDEVMTM